MTRAPAAVHIGFGAVFSVVVTLRQGACSVDAINGRICRSIAICLHLAGLTLLTTRAATPAIRKRLGAIFDAVRAGRGRAGRIGSGGCVFETVARITIARALAGVSSGATLGAVAAAVRAHFTTVLYQVRATGRLTHRIRAHAGIAVRRVNTGAARSAARRATARRNRAAAINARFSLVLLTVLTTGRAANVERLTSAGRAAVIARAIAVNTTIQSRATSLCGAHQRARATTIRAGFRAVLDAVAAGGSRASIRGRVADLALTIGIRKTFLAVQTTWAGCTAGTAAIDVGFIAVLNRVRATGFVAGLGRTVAHQALTILPGCAFESVGARRAAAATVHVGFARIEHAVGTGRRRAERRGARVENAIAVGVASLPIGALLGRRYLNAGAAAILTRFLPIGNPVGTTCGLALAVLTHLIDTIGGSVAH